MFTQGGIGPILCDHEHRVLPFNDLGNLTVTPDGALAPSSPRYLLRLFAPLALIFFVLYLVAS